MFSCSASWGQMLWQSGTPRASEHKFIMVVTVDDGGIPTDGLLGDVYPISLMDVAVKKVFRFIFFQQVHKAIKTPVGEIVEVVDVPGRSMGDQDIKAPVFVQLKPQPSDAAAHLSLSVHIFPVSVAVGTAQSQNTNSFIDIDLIFDTDTSVRRCLFVLVIVISPYI